MYLLIDTIGFLGEIQMEKTIQGSLGIFVATLRVNGVLSASVRASD